MPSQESVEEGERFLRLFFWYKGTGVVPVFSLTGAPSKVKGSEALLAVQTGLPKCSRYRGLRQSESGLEKKKGKSTKGEAKLKRVSETGRSNSRRGAGQGDKNLLGGGGPFSGALKTV